MGSRHGQCRLIPLQAALTTPHPAYKKTQHDPKTALCTQIGAAWLHHWVNQNTLATGEELDNTALGVASAVLAARSGDEAAGELFSLLGDGAFDAIKHLLTHQCVLPKPDALQRVYDTGFVPGSKGRGRMC